MTYLPTVVRLRATLTVEYDASMEYYAGCDTPEEMAKLDEAIPFDEVGLIWLWRPTRWTPN